MPTYSGAVARALLVLVDWAARSSGDWRNSAACKDMDPRDFDEMGTPVAWEACATTCQVVAECLARARREKPQGVYRAGQYWAESAGRRTPDGVTKKQERAERWQEWARLHELGMSLPKIAKTTGHHHATVLAALRKMGVA